MSNLEEALKHLEQAYNSFGKSKILCVDSDISIIKYHISLAKGLISSEIKTRESVLVKRP